MNLAWFTCARCAVATEKVYDGYCESCFAHVRGKVDPLFTFTIKDSFDPPGARLTLVK